MYLLGMSHCAHCLCAWQVRVRVGVMVRVRDRLMLKLTLMVRAHLESLGVLKLLPCCVTRSFDFLRLLCLGSGLDSGTLHWCQGLVREPHGVGTLIHPC